MNIVIPRRLDVDVRVPESRCPTCNHSLTGAAGDKVPRTGDFTLCAYCAELAVFGKDLALRPPTGDEVEAFYSAPDAARMQALARQHVDDLLAASWYGRAAAVEGVTMRDRRIFERLGSAVSAVVKIGARFTEPPSDLRMRPDRTTFEALVQAGALILHERGEHYVLIDPELWP